MQPVLENVDLETLNADALAGLDVVAGTWRGLPLGTPAIKGKGRQARLWPTLDVNCERNVFIGTQQAEARVLGRGHLRVVPTDRRRVRGAATAEAP